MLQGLGALEAVGLGRLGWLWGASGLRGTGSWVARVAKVARVLWGASGLRGTGSWGARVAKVARVVKVDREARGLIILWF